MVEKILHEKEAEIEKVTAEMKAAVERLELDINLLRESNNKLVEDIVRVEKERQLSEEKTEIELVQLKAQAEQEKTSLIKSYEDAIEAIRTDSTNKEEHIAQLVSKLSLTEESLKKQLVDKEEQLEEASVMHQDQLAKMSSQHLEEVQSLHRDYEKVIAVKVDQFNVESEQLSISHQKAIEDLQSRSSVELQELQDEFRMTFTALERKLAMEKEDLAQAHAKELAGSRNSYEKKIAVITKHHEGVIEVLNKNYEEAMDKVKKILTYIDDNRLMFFQFFRVKSSSKV